MCSTPTSLYTPGPRCCGTEGVQRKRARKPHAPEVSWSLSPTLLFQHLFQPFHDVFLGHRAYNLIHNLAFLEDE